MHSSGRSWADGLLGECTAPATAETLEEPVMVFSVFKDALAVDAAHHDMIDSRT